MKAKQVSVVIQKITQIQKEIYLLCFRSPYLCQTAIPGNFVHIKIPGVILRRPLSIHNVYKETMSVLFKVKGKGTKILSQYKPGEILDIIGPLGNGFTFPQETQEKQAFVLVAGGIGVAPLYFFARVLKQKFPQLSPRQIVVLLGAQSKQGILYTKQFKQLGATVLTATNDGTEGIKGTTVDLLPDIFSREKMISSLHVYACGPKEMFFSMSEILKNHPQVKCQISFEQFMGCGLGICCGCVIETKHGYKKVCKDGPVFDINTIW